MRHLQLRDVGFSVRSATCSYFIVNVLIDDELFIVRLAMLLTVWDTGDPDVMRSIILLDLISFVSVVIVQPNM